MKLFILGFLLLAATGCTLTQAQKDQIEDAWDYIPTATETPIPTATPAPTPVPPPTAIPTPAMTPETTMEINQRVVSEIGTQFGIPIVTDDFRGFYFFDTRECDCIGSVHHAWKNETGSWENFPYLNDSGVGVFNNDLR